MAGVSVDFKITGLEGLDRMQALFNPKLMDKATRGGMTYAARAAATAAAKEIRGRYNITSARVKQDITGPRFSNGGQTATLVFSRKPPSALQYGGVDRGRGLTMKIMRAGQRVAVTRGFIVKSGRLAGKPFRRVSDQRDSPIAFVSGPSVGSMFLRGGEFAETMQAAVNARINEQFIKGFERVLSSAARGYGGRSR